MTGNVIIIGNMNMDIRGVSEKTIRLEDSNPGRVDLSPGGVGRNVAHDLTLLRLRPKLMTALSDDEFGQMLERDCERLGIDLSLSIRGSGIRTGLFLYVTGPEHDMIVAICDTDVDKVICEETLRPKLDELNRADIVEIDGNLSEETILYICSHVTRPVFADPASGSKAVHLIPALKYIHTLKPNRTEAEVLTGLSDPEKAALKLRSIGVKNVYLSLGGDGMFVATDTFTGHIPAFRANVKNTIGAGDAVMAGLISAHLKGLGSKESAYYAMAAATIVTEHEEAIAPELSPETIEERLKNESLS
ncbi:MAG: hypothetical protein IK088_05430 [Lachnospiraceae bacterium]|nr:hypothetical protein [Lachnospiraceae bacterium]